MGLVISEIISKDKQRKEQTPNKELNNIIFQENTGLDLTEVRSLVLANGVKVDLKGADGKNEITNMWSRYIPRYRSELLDHHMKLEIF